MIRTYPDGTVYESDLTDIELRHPDNQMAMELVEALRKVSKALTNHLDIAPDDDPSESDMETCINELEAENEGLLAQVEDLKGKLAKRKGSRK
jgi:gamma-glutamyl:cysteine ligase YbdK (ATP-grasp superfamily)